MKGYSVNTNIKGLPEGEYFTEVKYSDRCAYKVSKHNTDKKITLVRVDVKPDSSWAPIFNIGGFSSNVSNLEDQTWLFNKIDHYEIVVRFSKAKNGWFDKYGARFIPNIAIHKYDYNF